jgi:hypothetical protein
MAAGALEAVLGNSAEGSYMPTLGISTSSPGPGPWVQGISDQCSPGHSLSSLKKVWQGLAWKYKMGK